MHGFLGILCSNINYIDKSALIKSINLADTLQTHTISTENYISAVSFHGSSPLKPPRYYETPDLVMLFAGDLVSYKSIPWVELEANISKSNFHWFSKLRGTFAFAVVKRKKNQAYLISDHRAQVPVYYGYLGNSFVFSTDISTFTTLRYVSGFNVKWLYEYMFFNIPIDSTTCLQNVYRLRPASLLKFDLASESTQIKRYAEYLKKPAKLMTGKSALDKCVATFKKVVPKYYGDGTINLIGITGGFDSRTLLALAPEDVTVKTYTYGTPGSSDLTAVSAIKKKVSLSHEEILFDENFIKSLPGLIFETVRLSGGVQSINRSTLLHVYRTLCSARGKTPIVISGVSGDHFFRGHGNVPAIISSAMEQFFQTGTALIDTEIYQEMFGEQFVVFQDHIEKCLQNIRALYGDPVDAETHLSYLSYEIGPKYFEGEASLASNYLIFRAPYWDMDLIKLSYEIEYSTLKFSRFLRKKKDSYRENVMQANVISATPFLNKVSINGIPLSFFARDNREFYQIGRLVFRGYAHLKRYMRAASYPPLEDWGNWFKHVLHAEFDNLLSEKSLIAAYIDKDFIFKIKKSNDTYWLGKLATTEILLNLIRNRWNL